MQCTSGAALARACDESASMARSGSYTVHNPGYEDKTGTYHGMLKQLGLTEKDLTQE